MSVAPLVAKIVTTLVVVLVTPPVVVQITLVAAPLLTISVASVIKPLMPARVLSRTVESLSVPLPVPTQLLLMITMLFQSGVLTTIPTQVHFSSVARTS
jgi:hypothetical protein